jgi:hypothetical protein
VREFPPRPGTGFIRSRERRHRLAGIGLLKGSVVASEALLKATSRIHEVHEERDIKEFCEQQNGGTLDERGQRRSAFGKKSARATAERSEKTERHSQLETGEAFHLYVRRINRNLTTLLEQLALLQAIVNAERESPTAIQDLGDDRGA